jgi:hypothetical protein
MIKFLSLPEAFYNQSTCPMCRENLHFDADVMQEWSDRYITNFTTITFQLDGELSLTADYETGNIIRWSQARPPQPIYVIGTDSVLDYNLSRQTAVATNIFAITLGCVQCHQYRRIFQIYLSKDKITHLFLNAEYLSVERNGNAYEMKNNFSKEITVYTPFDAGRSDGSNCTLPLIPFDLQNPLKTLERIQTLILFS